MRVSYYKELYNQVWWAVMEKCKGKLHQPIFLFAVLHLVQASLVGYQVADFLTDQDQGNLPSIFPLLLSTTWLASLILLTLHVALNLTQWYQRFCDHWASAEVRDLLNNKRVSRHLSIQLGIFFCVSGLLTLMRWSDGTSLTDWRELGIKVYLLGQLGVLILLLSILLAWGIYKLVLRSRIEEPSEEEVKDETIPEQTV